MKKIYLTSDLGFGDQGKGKCTALLCRKIKAGLTVRYNGGAQASHAVERDGIKHNFHMYGSGTLEGTPALLSRYVLIDPIVIWEEGRILKKKGVEIKDMLFIDENCLVTTTFHKIVNRAREISRGLKAHGSCGAGIGATVEYSLEFPDNCIRAKDTIYPFRFRQKLADLRSWAKGEVCKVKDTLGTIEFLDYIKQLDSIDEFDSMISVFPQIIRKMITFDLDLLHQKLDTGIVFEASQGILLDQDWGFHPYTTWSKATKTNAIELLSLVGADMSDVENIGIIRAYQTRHGAGPLPSETRDLDYITDQNNPFNEWQKEFRVGWLDLVLTKYAIHANSGIDSLAITCVDQLVGPIVKVATEYSVSPIHNTPGNLDVTQRLGEYFMKAKPKLEERKLSSFAWEIAAELEIPLRIISRGPETCNKIFIEYNRNWAL